MEIAAGTGVEAARKEDVMVLRVPAGTGWQSIVAERLSFVSEAPLGAKNKANAMPEAEKDLNYWKALNEVKMVLEKVPGLVPLHQTLAVLFEGQDGTDTPSGPGDADAVRLAGGNARVPYRPAAEMR